MTPRPRIFPSHLRGPERIVYRAVTVFFVVLFVALIWPVYPLFAGIRPMVLGVPLSLAYVVCLLLASFGVLLALFVWEGRRPEADEPDEEFCEGSQAREREGAPFPHLEGEERVGVRRGDPMDLCGGSGSGRCDLATQAPRGRGRPAGAQPCRVELARRFEAERL